MHVLDGGIIHLAVVHSETATAIFLPGHHQCCGPGAGGGPDDSLLQHLFDLLIFFVPHQRTLALVGEVDKGALSVYLVFQEVGPPIVLVVLWKDPVVLL